MNEIDILDTLKSDKEATKCTGCKGDNLYLSSHEVVCFDCGLVNNNHVVTDNSVPFESVEAFPKRNFYTNSKGNARLKRMQEWYMWTNDEKNEYKLVNYTKELCAKLDIAEILTSNVCDTVVEVINVIKKHDGTKRARVKDGIILTCIQYVSKGNQVSGTLLAVDLAKKINLDIKYVTKAEKIILELISTKKLRLDKQSMLETQQPYDYVLNVVKRKALKIPDAILRQVRELIQLCDTNDLLLDHTPLSIGVCCFYYILKANNIELDAKMFSDLYDLSVVTVVKTYNKLRQYDQFIVQQFSAPLWQN